MPFAVKAKCFNGQSYDLSLDAAAPSVADLQTAISDASGITPDRQTLLFKGRVLESGHALSEYDVADAAVISVVRRIGKSPTPAAPAKAADPAPPAPAPAATPTAAPEPAADAAAAAAAADPNADPAAGVQPPSLEEMMRTLNMGAAAGAGGAPGGMPPLGGLSSLLGAGAAGAGAGAGPGAGVPGAGIEQLFAAMPQVMNGLINTPLFKEYFNNTEKQEQSREAILNNPIMRGILESDAEFAKVVNDPEKWRASMEAAKSLFTADGEADGEAGGGGAAAAAAAAAAGMAKAGGTGAGADGETPSGTTFATSTAAAPRGMASGKRDLAASRQSAADMAPAGLNIRRLSESYGHALGQSLINSGLGLDPDLVGKGLKSAVDGNPFPMALPEYERAMATLQNIASEFLKKANLEDANTFFEELKGEKNMIVVEENRIAYEKSEVAPDESAPAAEAKSTVLVIVSARLLDGRHFFTCPAADDQGESVHPLTLPLETAPAAMAKGIVGMRENESRLLYVHPEACDGMTDMFGDLLPPNALLIFDLQLVSANAPDEETVGESYYSG